MISITSRFYWGDNYVPAFIPVTSSETETQSLGQIPAHQLRDAAIRSSRLKQLLTSPERPTKHSVQLPGIYYHYTRGSRFLFHVDSEITCWDARSGKKIVSIKPLEPTDWERSPMLAIASVCRSNSEIFLAVLWEKRLDYDQQRQRQRMPECKVFLETLVVTVRALDSGSSLEGDTTLDGQLAATFSSRNLGQIYTRDPSLRCDPLLRFGGQYIVLQFHSYIMVFDWENLDCSSPSVCLVRPTFIF